MKNFYLTLAAFCIFFFILKNADGQNLGADTGLHQVAVNNANAFFNRAIGPQSALYNGPEYIFYNAVAIRGSGYFMDKIGVTGSVYYDGAAYKNIPLTYDVYKDELVTVLYNNFSYFSLLKARVQNFDLLDHHFININTDTLPNNKVIKGGYYDELYHGRMEVLVKITKTIKEYTSTIGSAEAYSTFTPAIQEYFISKDKVYYTITSEGSLLDVLKDRKKQLKQYIRTNNIKFRQDPGQALVAIVSYYDRLSN